LAMLVLPLRSVSLCQMLRRQKPPTVCESDHYYDFDCRK
jgi:hypothetical protein